MTPADIVNRALDALGTGLEIGDPDLQGGTKQERVALRAYGPVMRQMLRAAHWTFARKEGLLTLLQDQTGQSVGFSTTPGTAGYIGLGTPAMGSWIYEYAWPVDAVAARWMPLKEPYTITSPPGNIAQPGSAVAQVTGLNGVAPFTWQRRARFLVTNDAILNEQGALTDWTQVPDWQGVQGQGPNMQTVILTNVQNATLVYTALIPYPNMWDPLFQEAMVAALAERMALQLVDDKRLALAIQGQQIKIAQDALETARTANANEGVTNTDIIPDWVRTRRWGSSWSQAGPWASGFGPNMDWCGWDSYSFSNGSTF